MQNTNGRSLKKILSRCAEIHRNLEPIKQKMINGIGVNAEIELFEKEQGKSIDLLSKAMGGEFKPTG